MLRVERANTIRVTGDQGRRDVLGIAGNRQLFGMVADRLWLVEHIGALRLSQLQQPGAGHVLHVEGRILAHHDRIEAGQRLQAGLARAVPVVGVAGQLQRTHHRFDLMGRERQLRLQAGKQLMAAFHRLHHHGVGRVLVGLEGVQRVGNKQNAHVGSSRSQRLSQRIGLGSVFSSSSDAASKASRATTPYI